MAIEETATDKPVIGNDDHDAHECPDPDYWGDPSEPEPREFRVGSSIVRRLTPTECARLQGYPDDWCNLGEWTDTAGKVHKPADTPVYKAYGNSLALPFWAWLTRRIAAQYEGDPPTLGSLFDGIGGFPLCWARVNGPRSVKWASEIEEFPIAVTKKHFGDEEKGEVGDIAFYL